VNGVRALFLGDLGAPAVWQGLVIMAALAGLALFWAARLFARSVR
jgi:ABC-2 type transport system permease protein